jgi:hypothetical protein
MRLSIETFDRRVYLRILCKCGRNEKLGRELLHETMFDGNDVLRLRDGVLYL